MTMVRRSTIPCHVLVQLRQSSRIILNVHLQMRGIHYRRIPQFLVCAPRCHSSSNGDPRVLLLSTFMSHGSRASIKCLYHYNTSQHSRQQDRVRMARHGMNYDSNEQLKRKKAADSRRLLLIVAFSLALYICVDQILKERVPVIGRKRLLLLPLETEKEMGLQQFKMIKANSRVLPAGHEYSTIVRRVGNRIKAVAGTDLGFQWEFIVIDEPVENAFCLPGGKVVFYKGLMDKLFTVGDDAYRVLDMNEKESMIAAVMGHEISHALLRHHGEQITMRAKMSILLLIVRAFVGGELPGDTLLMNVGVLLPYSRKHEYEADLIGLYLMSRACYNPEYAIKTFEKMKEASQMESKLVGYVSTHPTFGDRLDVFRKHMKNAHRERAKFCYTRSEVMQGHSGKKKSVEFWWDDMSINID